MYDKVDEKTILGKYFTIEAPLNGCFDRSGNLVLRGVRHADVKQSSGIIDKRMNALQW
jgi:hypothetical protein